MDSKEPKRDAEHWSRRRFLQAVGGVPTLSVVLKGSARQAASQGEQVTEDIPRKFTPIDLRGYFTASSAAFGPRDRAKELGSDSMRDGLVRMPAGKRNLQGIPFWLGPEAIEAKSWIVLSGQGQSWATARVDIPIGRQAHFVCLASFCDWDSNETLPSGDVLDQIEKVGEPLANAIFVYEGGGQNALPIRRRFEVNSPTYRWGHEAFAAMPHTKAEPVKLTDPLSNGMAWGPLQDGIREGRKGERLGTLWITALPNSMPSQPLEALRMEAAGKDSLVICGITLFHGVESPLRYERLRLYRFALPEATAEEEGRWKVSVDLGIVARTYVLGNFSPDIWLSSSATGIGERANPIRSEQYLYAEITASPAATVTLSDLTKNQQYQFDLSEVAPEKELEARPSGARIQVLEREKVWLWGHVLDSVTHSPTPVRLAFRSKEGRYIPPYGHRTEINDGWFQDYGADAKLLDTSFAYVDGTFQVELPTGDVFLEMTKGFEYQAVRKKLNIQPGQRELKLEIPRFVNLRSEGWVTADTHVHFLSPTTAVLEGQAEGLNLIHLLAMQCGDLFTNVADLSQGPLTSRDGETMVWVGTENRQHILGHIALLGGHGEPVYPLSASGPGRGLESYLGDPAWTSLAEWADACRKREGLAVAAHIPYPTGEIAADIVLGKYDAVEIWPQYEFNSLRYLDWYRYLNCGYRLPAVGGTDKMAASMPVGTNRVYAYLGREEFSFANWAAAVRSGNTFVTSGPLLFFQADGQHPGSEIPLNAGGGTIEVRIEAKCFVPVDRLEVIWNGRVVASSEQHAGTREMTLRERLHVNGPGWLAARCSSRIGPTAENFRIAAHTSPIYVGTPGQELFSEPAAAYFLTLIEGCQTWVENLAVRPDAEKLARVRAVLADAHAKLEGRMHRH